MSNNLNTYDSASYGATQTEDMQACHLAMTVLPKHYPDHPWLIGCEHFSGMIHCRLQYGTQEVSNNGHGFMLKLSTILGHDGEKRIMLAGGECLERYNLFRGAATEESEIRAMQNGLNLDNIVGKSKH